MAVPNDRELMRLHAEALFTHDSAGRLLRVNEPEGKEAPRFFFGRTAHGNLWRFRHGLDEELVRELEAACSAEPAGDDALAPDRVGIYEALLARAAPVQRTWAGPAYRFPAELPATADAVPVTEQNAGVLRPHLEGWLGDVALSQPMLAVLVDGRAVALCCSVRITARAHEAGVETAPEFRGRGHAAGAVVAWARAVRGMGRVPLYSTSWENAASRALARKLGLRRYGADLHVA